MKIIIVTIILFASHPLYSAQGELPKYFDMESLNLNKIPFGKELEINAWITIPNPHKDRIQNKALRVYEKIDGQWIKSTSLDAIPVFHEKNKLQIKGKVKLQSSKSDVAIDSTITHCGKYCVINNFQGIAKRNPKIKSPLVNLKIVGYLPTDKIKKQ